MGLTHARQSGFGRPLGLTLVLTALALTSITPYAQAGAVLLVLASMYGEMTLRRHVSVAAIVVSPLFAAQSFLGLRLPLLIIVSLSLGILPAAFIAPNMLRLRAAVIPFAALAVLAINYIVRRPITIEGDFAVFEQGIILALAALFSVRVGDVDAAKVHDGFHYALCATALVGGIAALLALSTTSAEIAATRQVASVFGASNYVTDLMTVATVACVHRALDRKSIGLNTFIAFALVGLSLPQSSRTSSIVLAAVLLLLFKRKGHLGIPVFIGVTVLASSQFFLLQLPVMARFKAQSASVDDLNGRVTLWQFALARIESHGILGLGPGNLTSELQNAGFNPLYVHNIWLSLMAQYGIFSILWFAIVLRPMIQRRQSDYCYYLAVTLLLISTFEPAVETLKIGTIFMCLLALRVPSMPGREVGVHDHRRRRISL